MTSKYKISVLLPSRGRIAALEKSVVTLLERASDAKQIEILLALDKDDKAVIEFATGKLKEFIKEGGLKRRFNQIIRLTIQKVR